MNHIISWKDNTPRSEEYDDTYFSTDSGLSESEYVFIKHNDLKARFQSNQNHSIAELGFGFGLNFLVTLQEWAAAQPRTHQYLDYIGIEKNPPEKEALLRALSAWPSLKKHLDTLITHYPPPIDGLVRINLPDHQVRLTLLIGDVTWALDNMVPGIDTWYLDGFTPTKNPDMWQESLFEKMAGLSNKHAQFSTFTASGYVRRGLESAGFEVKKDKGFGRKREMLYGRLKKEKPIKTLPAHYCLPTTKKIQKIAVIGAGIAGCAQAAALAQRGFDVHLFEKANQIGSGGSAVPQASLKPVIHVTTSPYEQFYNSGLLYTAAEIQRLKKKGACFDSERLPTLLLAHNQKTKHRIKNYITKRNPDPTWATFLNAKESSDYAGTQIPYESLLLPISYRINPQSFAHALIDEWTENITRRLNSPIQRLSFSKQKAILQGVNTGTEHFDYVIMADAFSSGLLKEIGTFPVCHHAGQTTTIHQQQILQCQLAYGGYCIPYGNALHLGSTFRQRNEDAGLRACDNVTNIDALQKILPQACLKNEAHTLSFAGTRCHYSDHLPLIGPIMDEQSVLYHYKKWILGNRQCIFPEANYLPLSLTTAFGSKGLLGALIGAEHIASLLCGSPPLTTTLIKHTHPHRIWLKQKP